LVIQPLIGAASDRTWGRFGRRKPYFIIGALGCSIMLFLFPFVTALWMAFLFMWLLDASNNTAMEPYRAFISDRLPKNQLARGFLVQSMFVGLGAVLANLSLLVFPEDCPGWHGCGDSLLGVCGLLGWRGVLHRIGFGVGAHYEGDSPYRRRARRDAVEARRAFRVRKGDRQRRS
jgi:MFS family permease